MNICLIIDDYLPDSIKVGAKMMHELALEMKGQGHDVAVVTPAPKQKEKVNITTLDGVIVCRFRSGEIKNVGKIKRAINETLLSYYAWNSLKDYFKKNHYDCIIYYSPTIFWSGLIGKLKHLWSAPAYLILRDLFPQWAIDQGLIRQGSRIEKYFRFFEKKNYDAADTIGLMSQKNLDWFTLHQDVSAKTEILYNWADNLPVVSNGDYRKKLELNDKVIYFYGGNMGHAQDMMNIIRLAKRMQDYPEAHFLLVGKGDEFDLVQSTIEADKIDNITLLPAVTQDEFKKIMSECDVGLFTLHKNHKTHNFPGKLLGYMVQSLPILGSINLGNDLQEVVENANAGLVSINGDDELFYQNALKFLDETLRREIGSNANRLLEKTFSVKAATKQILDCVKK